tara:strand:- start:120 stop:1085 length:966 start_codon:yes stop_codon:yes gene_type:complete
MQNKFKNKILITLGPSTLNAQFLRKAKMLKVDLLRLNMSHLSVMKLKKNISFIKKYTNVPICIDTEGAQIRTKTQKTKLIKKNSILKISDTDTLNLYPDDIHLKLKKNDILDVGFKGLKIKVTLKKSNKLICKVLSTGILENNKGVHIKNRKVKLNYLTKKDFLAIKIGKKLGIKNFALSFTNTPEDIKKFNKILNKENKIFKLETKLAIKNLDKIFKIADKFIIDRGDLSKDIKLEQIPIFQRIILKKGKTKNKKIFVATNFLESMIKNNYPTRAEINDIFNAFELGASGLVLAAETAIGKYPTECIELVNKIFKQFKKY